MLWDYFMERLLLLLLLGQIYLVYHIGFVLQRMDYIYNLKLFLIQYRLLQHGMMIVV